MTTRRTRDELTEFRLETLEKWMGASTERWDKMFKVLNDIRSEMSEMKTDVAINRFRVGFFALSAGGLASLPAVLFVILK